MSDLSFWVIYKDPSDIPAPYVVREWRIINGAPTATANGQTACTLEYARALIPSGKVPIGRTQTDDPAIDEVWV